MISKLFLLLVVILIILGLYCSDKPIKLETFSTPNLTGSKKKLYNNEYAPPNNLNKGGLNVDNSNTFSSNDIEYYDPEDKLVCGADYTNCNNTHDNIAGCTTKYEKNKASNFRKDATIEMYSNSSSTDIADGASQIYDRGLSNNLNSTTSESLLPPPLPPTPPPCNKPTNEQCRNCDILLNKDIDKYVIRSSVPPCPDLKEYAKKSMLCPCRDMSKYILKRDIPKCPTCPKHPKPKCPIPKCPKPKCPKPKCPPCPRCPKCPQIDLDKYITRTECNRLRREDKRLWEQSATQTTTKDTRFSQYNNQPFNHNSSCTGYGATGEFYS